MHEYEITKRIAGMIAEESLSRGIKPKKAFVEIGALTTYKPEPIKHYFSILRQEDTVLKGVELDVRTVPAIIRCRQCNKEIEVQDLPFCQDCATADVEILSGEDIRLRRIEHV